MNNGNNWTKNKCKNRDSQRGNGRSRTSGGSKHNRRTNNGPRSDGGQRNFPKFIDTNRPNSESNYWPQTDRNCDNRNIQHHGNGGGIFPWVRKNPFNPLVIPQHIVYEEPNGYKETPINNKEEKVQNASESVKTSLHHENGKEMSTSKTAINSASIANTEAGVEASELHYKNSKTIQVKQEKDIVMNLKQERKSSSSSSSSSSESSSSEEETISKNKTTTVKPDLTTNSNPLTSPLNIKLKPKASSPTSTPLKTNKLKSMSNPSPDEVSTPPPKLEIVVDKKEKSQVARKEVKSKSEIKKNSSEEDVVCIGNLERKIVLEDESDSTDTTDEETDDNVEETYKEILSKNFKKSSKKSAEVCMICDKKGHTSFQCQMICKNCSEPYHGYRTCPQPANLNTMLQIFMEFCMQQFQNFNIEKQNTRNSCISVPKAQVNAPQSSVNMKSNKAKRKSLKTSESNEKMKTSKKRKLSPAKKLKSKNDSDDCSDDENDTASEISTAESKENTSDSIAESIVSSKKKRKTKSKNTAKNALNLSNFSTNPVNLPMVLNSFPNLTVPTVSVQNPSTSANALNTLLLTQMFQNAIGSLKQ